MLIVTMRNVWQAGDVADYEVKVYVNRDLIAAYSVVGHNRSDGWAELVRRVGEVGMIAEGVNDLEEEQ